MQKYLVHEEPAAAAATHALVIGVGAYPHLIGGTGPLSPDHDGMKQLTSPPVSAREFAKLLVSRFHHPTRPLASVALLLSEAHPAAFTNPKSAEALQVAEANYDHAAEAIQAWKTRGEANPDNLLIFYFCGHGISQGSDMSLLFSDYGSTPAPLDHALDFRKFRLAMSRNLPAKQIYFVDACRASSDTLIESFGFAGRLPIQGGGMKPAEAPVFYATIAGEQAFGKANESSIFASALMSGLKGAGADDSEGDWRVTTTRLKEAIDYYVSQSGAKRAQVPPTDELTTFEILRVPDQPEVPVMITCDPETLNLEAELICESAGVVRNRRAPNAEQWALPLPAGSYRFRAEFAAGGRAAIQKDAWVRPVYKKVPLEDKP
jgi:hypothetical protein